MTISNTEKNNHSETNLDAEEAEKRISVLEGIYLEKQYFNIFETQKLRNRSRNIGCSQNQRKVNKTKMLKQITIDKLF